MLFLPSSFHQQEHLSNASQHIKYLDNDCVQLSFSKPTCSVSLCSTEESFESTQEYDNCSLNRIEFLNGIILNVQTDDIGDSDDFDFSDHHLELHQSFDDHAEKIANGVRFDVDENDFIIEYHYEYPMCDDYDVYTTSEEEVENRRQLVKETRSFQRRQRGLIRRLDNLYEHEEYSTYPTAFDEWCSSELRGFENSLLNESSFQISKYVDFVVTYYHGLQELVKQRHADIEDDTHELLRNRIVLLSRKSRNFAEHLAAGDEVEAKIQS